MREQTNGTGTSEFASILGYDYRVAKQDLEILKHMSTDGIAARTMRPRGSMRKHVVFSGLRMVIISHIK